MDWCQYMIETSAMNELNNITVWDVSRYGIFSGPYFPAFRLNAEI